jgi:Kef-type K+ transport system membrane component KefB
MEHGTDLVNDMAICILVAWLLAVIAHRFKQPLILAYLLAGFLIGPKAIKLIDNPDSLDTISSLGLILLMYMIGLEIDMRKVITSGKVITLTAAVQILGGFFLCFVFFQVLFPRMGTILDSLYLSVAASLSSTVIIVKILYDKRELDTLPGRLTLGVLILQDVFAILFLAIQPNLQHPSFGVIFKSLEKVALLILIAFAASRYGLPYLFRGIARLPELVVVGALAWCFTIAGVATRLDLSDSLGALIAGVAISTFPYSLDVTAKITSLRDFFVTLFFVSLGMTIPMPSVYIFAWSIVFCLFLVLSRFVTVCWPLNVMKQGHRASIIPAINLSQVSEFSLVIMAIGVSSGDVSENAKGVTAYAFVILAVASTYIMMRSEKVMKRLSMMLSDLNIRDLDEQTMFLKRPDKTPEIVFLGFAWTASSLLEEIRRMQPDWLRDIAVIDFNPEAAGGLHKRGVHVKYGDVSQRDTLVHAGVGEAKVIVSTLPNTVLRGTDNLRLLQELREINPTAKIIMQAELLTDVPKLYKDGADYVQVARLLQAVELVSIIEYARARRLGEKREEQAKELVGRDEVIP